MMLYDLSTQILDELNYGGILAKHKSVNKLFPTFDDRVDAVAGHGGVHLSSWRNNLWHFKINSGTKSGVKYDGYIKFPNIEQTIKDKVKDKKLWKQNGSGVDLRKFSIEVMYDTDLQLYCSCPAFLYWGPAFILTVRKAKYTKPENRPPVERNPRQHGAACKHASLLLDVYPMYAPTMAKFINHFYADTVKQAEQDVLGNDKKESEKDQDKEQK